MKGMETKGKIIEVKVSRVKEIRASELLYNKKWTEKDYYNLMRIGCMRIYNLKRNLIV